MSCSQPNAGKARLLEKPIPATKQIFTQPAGVVQKYIDFDAAKAINHIAAMENEYFNSYDQGGSKYYGTTWSEYAANEPFGPTNLFNPLVALEDRDETAKDNTSALFSD